MNVLLKWFKRQVSYLALAMANVEKNAFGQSGDVLSDDIGTVQRHRQGTVADDLLQGRITQEVTLLRARLYKVIEAVDELENAVKPILNDKGEITGYDISESFKKKPIHRTIKGDPSDDYKVSMVINNEPITASVLDSFERIGKYGIKQDNSIVINRDILPKFQIEKYATRLFIRDIDSEHKLLEFYIPKYPDQFDRKTNLLISTIKKSILQPKNSDLLDIKSVGFITNNDIGVKDFLEFQYLIEKYDKIVEHDGNYIIKFIAKPMVEDNRILEKYKNDELEEKYKNKESRE